MDTLWPRDQAVGTLVSILALKIFVIGHASRTWVDQKQAGIFIVYKGTSELEKGLML